MRSAFALVGLSLTATAPCVIAFVVPSISTTPSQRPLPTGTGPSGPLHASLGNAADESCDVLILGAGPTGRAISSLLAKQNLNICLADVNADRPFPNCGVWQDEWDAVVEKYAACGIPLEGGDYGKALNREWGYADCFFGGSFNEKPMSKRSSLFRPYCQVDKQALFDSLCNNEYDDKVRILEYNAISKATGINLYSPSGSLVHDEDGTTTVLENKTKDAKILVRSKLVIDSTGHESTLVLREPSEKGAVGFQIGYGCLVNVKEDEDPLVASLRIGPYDKDAMTLFDYRTDHLESKSDSIKEAEKEPTFMYAMPIKGNQVFFQEKSLVARPGTTMDFQECKDRCLKRLEHWEIAVEEVVEEEYSYVPMGQSLPLEDQRVIGLSGNAAILNPSTGYSLCRTLLAASDVADAIEESMNSEVPMSLDQISASAYQSILTPEAIRECDLAARGGKFLMKQDVAGLRGFLDGFFSLPPKLWTGFLAGKKGWLDNDAFFSIRFLSKIPRPVANKWALNALTFSLKKDASFVPQSVLLLLADLPAYDDSMFSQLNQNVGDIVAKRVSEREAAERQVAAKLAAQAEEETRLLAEREAKEQAKREVEETAKREMEREISESAMAECLPASFFAEVVEQEVITMEELTVASSPEGQDPLSLEEENYEEDILFDELLVNSLEDQKEDIAFQESPVESFQKEEDKEDSATELPPDDMFKVTPDASFMEADSIALKKPILTSFEEADIIVEDSPVAYSEEQEEVLEVTKGASFEAAEAAAIDYAEEEQPSVSYHEMDENIAVEELALILSDEELVEANPIEDSLTATYERETEGDIPTEDPPAASSEEEEGEDAECKDPLKGTEENTNVEEWPIVANQEASEDVVMEEVLVSSFEEEEIEDDVTIEEALVAVSEEEAENNAIVEEPPIVAYEEMSEEVGVEESPVSSFEETEVVEDNTVEKSPLTPSEEEVGEDIIVEEPLIVASEEEEVLEDVGVEESPVSSFEGAEVIEDNTVEESLVNPSKKEAEEEIIVEDASIVASEEEELFEDVGVVESQVSSFEEAEVVEDNTVEESPVTPSEEEVRANIIVEEPLIVAHEEEMAEDIINVEAPASTFVEAEDPELTPLQKDELEVTVRMLSTLMEESGAASPEGHDELIVVKEPLDGVDEQEATFAEGLLREEKQGIVIEATPSMPEEEAPIDVSVVSSLEDVQGGIMDEKEGEKEATILELLEEGKKRPIRNISESASSKKKKKKRKGRKKR